MSALGHKQTFAVQKGMSALPPIADMKILHGAFLFETRTKAVFCFGVSVETRYMTALKGILRVGRDVLLIALSTVALGEVGLRIYNSIDP
ncbi:MAG: hypothetical protein WBV51_18775, partial [Pseudolabrys sp.]